MKRTRAVYADLSGKQKEIYNFQKLAGLLADYGYTCIKLDDDWGGADFLAHHKDGDETLKVQLKSRVTLARKYQGKDLVMAFPIDSVVDTVWYLIEHDELLRLVEAYTPWLASKSWKDDGEYSVARPRASLRDALAPFAVGRVLK